MCQVQVWFRFADSLFSLQFHRGKKESFRIAKKQAGLPASVRFFFPSRNWGCLLLVSSLSMNLFNKHFWMNDPGQRLQALNDPGSRAIHQI